ncbi:unnamed protein product [Brassica oleracea]
MVCSQSADTRPCGTSSRRLDLSTERSTVARFSLTNLASCPPNTIDDHASIGCSDHPHRPTLVMVLATLSMPHILRKEQR